MLLQRVLQLPRSVQFDSFGNQVSNFVSKLGGHDLGTGGVGVAQELHRRKRRQFHVFARVVRGCG
jgi:hypothetical protein